MPQISSSVSRRGVSGSPGRGPLAPPAAAIAAEIPASGARNDDTSDGDPPEPGARTARKTTARKKAAPRTTASRAATTGDARRKSTGSPLTGKTPATSRSTAKGTVTKAPKHQLDGVWNPEEVRQQLDRLIESARGSRRALVLTHDNPDPDSIASAIGLAHLLEKLAGVPTTVGYGGIVGRAENRALVRVLKLPIVPVSRIVFDDFDLIALVDTQPECGNHSVLPRYPVNVVLDHHPERASSRSADFAEVGGDYGATATIVASYVRAAGIVPDTQLATALFYGIKSDTRDLGREFEPVDVELYHWLFPLVDHQALSKIEHPQVPAHYFAALHRAIGHARMHGEAVVADLDEVYAPDIVAEVAERLLSLEDTRWSLAFGAYEGHLYFSVRTSDRRMNAGRLVREVLGGFGGSAGGHGSMAGGRVPLVREARGDKAPVPITDKERASLKQRLLRAFLKEFDAPSRGEPLV